MSQVKFIRVRHKISGAIRSGRGITANEATKRAHVALEVLRIPSIETIEQALDEIERRFASSVPDRAKEPLGDLYDMASRIIDLSGFMADTSIDQAALALCEIVDQSLTGPRTNWAAIDVSIRALRLLQMHGPSLAEDRRAVIIKGLRDVMAKTATQVDAG